MPVGSLPVFGLRDREQGDSELRAQLRNWVNFVWLSGDLCLESLPSTIDACLWAKGAHPVSATGICGRGKNEPLPKFGDSCDFMEMNFRFADGCTMRACGRYWKESFNQVASEITGTKGFASLPSGSQSTFYRRREDCERVYDFKINERQGTKIEPVNPQLPLWKFRAGKSNSDQYQVEQDLWIKSILENRRSNNVDTCAETTITTIMGRMAAYSGKTVTWDEALNSREQFMPDELTWDSPPPTMPTKYGDYPVPARGRMS